MPMFYWIIVYSALTLLVSYMLYDIVISELITHVRLKRQSKHIKQRQNCCNNLLNVSNSYQSELQNVKKVVIIKYHLKR